MTSLKLSLVPPALVRLHDALTCLAKFSDTVAIEAEHDLLRLSALNSTKTAFASFVCERVSFFESYEFTLGMANRASFQSQGGDRFYCQILLKALLSVFRGRVDRNKDTAVERCEMELHEDPKQTECRLTIKMICGLDVIKLYKLTYEPAAIQHAVFDRRKTSNQWSADPRFLRKVVDHFSMSAEQLDMFSQGEQAVFTSFTTKITEGKEILKHPVHTSVAADKRDFEEYLVEDGMHVAINLKDFKAVVSHAETANATVTARYTRPCKPLQLAYEFEGVSAEFTIMTRGETENEEAPQSSRATIPQLSRRTPAAPTPTPISASVPITVRNDSFRATQNSQMPPPPSRSRSIRPLNGSSTQQHLSQTPASAVEKREEGQGLTGSESMEFDSLFVPQDDDRQWDEMNDEEEPQDILGWDATGGQDTFEGSLRDAEPGFPKTTISRKPPQDDMGIPPTQRMSQVRGLGLFD